MQSLKQYITWGTVVIGTALYIVSIVPSIKETVTLLPKWGWQPIGLALVIIGLGAIILNYHQSHENSS